MTTEDYIARLKDYVYAACVYMTREPEDCLKHPYTVPGTPDSPYYSATLWDWDSWLTGIALGQAEKDSGGRLSFKDCEKGNVLNFLDMCTPEGYIPIAVTPGRTPRLSDGVTDRLKTNMHKPVLCQQAAALIARSGGDAGWLGGYMPRLESYLNRYLTEFCNKDTGLLFWKDDFAVGVDNDPSVFFRPQNSCGSIYLNSLMYREELAAGYIYEQLGDMERANAWRVRADSLSKSINEYCWDERDGCYYSVDFALNPVVPGAWLHHGAPRDYPCLLQRVDSWSIFMPLWAGLAPCDRAVRLLKRAEDEATFACGAGIRTLSRLEKCYDLRASNNPSNWRGPTWIVANYMVFSGMVKYGFNDAAANLAQKTIRLLGRDIEVNGCLHEYYNPDTGFPIVTHKFLNWNLLVLNMIAWLEGREFIDTF